MGRRSGVGERAPGEAGFTLIELSIVIFIIAIISAIAIPRIRDVTSAELASTVRRLANATRLAYEEAAYRNRVLALTIDLEHQTYWIATVDPSTGEFVESDSPLFRKTAIPPDVRIADVVLPGMGKLSQGVIPTFFYPEGFADRTVIHVVDVRQNAYTLRVDPIRGRSEILDGYKDFEGGR